MVAKQILHLLVSAIWLLICAPLLAVVAVAIKLDSPGPVFSRQERIGKDSRPFLYLQVPHDGAGSRMYRPGP